MLEKGTTVFGHWTVDEEIGSGAFGTVYKLSREDFGVTYHSALKVISIPPEKSDALSLKSEGMSKEEISAYYSDIALNFMEEIKLLEELKGNSNIVCYEDHLITRSDDGMAYTIMIKMELLTPLKNRLAEQNLSRDEVLRLGIDICSALEICERRKIIHRDIKPDNIFISDSGAYKLGDFGVARTMEKTIAAMSQKGTYTYMAPEVFLGKEYNQSVDLYSLGILLYQLLNKNRTPFLPEAPQPIKFVDRENAQKKRMSGNLLPWIKGLPDSWNGFLVRLCHPDPAVRFGNATEVKALLLRMLQMGDAFTVSVNTPTVNRVPANDPSVNTPSVNRTPANNAPVNIPSLNRVPTNNPSVNTPSVNGTPANNPPVNIPSVNKNPANVNIQGNAYNAGSGGLPQTRGGKWVNPPSARSADVSGSKDYYKFLINETASAKYYLSFFVITFIFSLLNALLVGGTDLIYSVLSQVACVVILPVLLLLRLVNFGIGCGGKKGFLNKKALYSVAVICNYLWNLLIIAVFSSGTFFGGSDGIAFIVLTVVPFGVALLLCTRERNFATFILSKILYWIASLMLVFVCCICFCS